MKRGDVYWLEVADLGRRPVMLMTNDRLAGVLRRVVVAGVTTTVRSVDSEVGLDVDDGMPRRCAVNLLELSVVPSSLLVERITTVDEGKLAQVCAALRFVTDC